MIGFTAFIIIGVNESRNNKCEIRHRIGVDNNTSKYVNDMVSDIYHDLRNEKYHDCYMFYNTASVGLSIVKGINKHHHSPVYNIKGDFVPYHIKVLTEANPLISKFIESKEVGSSNYIKKPKILSMKSPKFKTPIIPVQEVPMKEIYDKLLKSLPDENNDLIYKQNSKMNKIADIGYSITAEGKEYILLIITRETYFVIYDGKVIQENVFLKAKNPLTKIF